VRRRRNEPEGEVEVGEMRREIGRGGGLGVHGLPLYSVLRDGHSRAHLRSSNRASLLGLADWPFSYEVGTAEMVRAGLPNKK
jgi:hypothetical protein